MTLWEWVLSGKFWVGLIGGYLLGKYLSKQVESILKKFFKGEEKRNDAK